jgi:hypothetical protein
MLMLIGCAVVVLGVIIGCYTVSGSGIHKRSYGRDRHVGESPLDSPWTMRDWSRGTQSRAGRRRR